MKTLLMIRKPVLISFFLFTAMVMNAQTVKTIGPSGDYTTFSAAVTALNSMTLTAPIIFKVADGTYTEQISIGQINGVSSTNTISFQSDKGDSSKVILTYASGSYTLQFNGADYVRFQGMTIKNTSTSSAVINFTQPSNNPCTYNTITNCVIESGVTSSTSNTYAAIYHNSTSSSSGGYGQYNSLKYNVIKNGSYNIYWNNGTSTTYFNSYNDFSNNIASGAYYYGFYFSGQYYMTFSNNDISLTSAYTSTKYAVYLNYLYGNSSGTLISKIDNNKITVNTASGANYGIYAQSCYYYTMITNNKINITGTSTIYNLYFSSCYYTTEASKNELTANGTSTIYLFYGTSCYYNTNFRQNTLKATGNSSTYGFYVNSCNYDLDVADNTLDISSTSTVYGMSIWNSSQGPQFKNNLIEVASTSGQQFGVQIYTSSNPNGTRIPLFANNRIILKGTTTTTGQNYGMYISGFGSSSSYRSQIVNNFISQINGNCLVQGILITSSNTNYCDIAFNNININTTYKGNSSPFTSAFFIDNTNTGLVFKNNNLVMKNTGYCMMVNTANPGMESNNNNFYYTGSALAGFYGGKERATLTLFQRLFQNNDVSSISVNPNYTSTTDLHTSNASLQRGVPVSGVTLDIDGQTRSTSYPYIGADEDTTTRVMTFVQSTTIQPNTSVLLQNTTFNEIIGVVIEFNGTSGPTYTATKLDFNTTGTTSLSDITNANLYYTGSNGVLSTTTSFGSTISTPGSTLSFTGTQVLKPGLNYFWLSFDVPSTATLGNFVDAQCTAITIDSSGTTLSKTPTVTNPSGNRKISEPMYGTYTINPSGSGSRNFVNFTDAASDLTARGMNAAVIFNVSNGTYNEQVVLSSINGLSATNTLLFQSVSGDSSKVILTSSSATSSANYTLKLDAVSYISWKNMTIQNTNTSYGRVLELANGSNYNKFYNNRLIGMKTTTTSDYMAVVYSYGTSNTTHCQYNEFKYNIITDGSYGIYFYGWSYPSTYSFVANNNIVSGFYYTGMYIYNFRGIQTNNNTISTTSGTTVYGINGGQWAYTSQANYNTINLTTSSSAYGINLNNNYYNNQTNNNTITINSSSSAYGIYLSGCYYDNEVKTNKVSITATSTAYGLYLNSNYYTLITTNNDITVTATSTQYGIYYYYSQNVNGSNRFRLTHNKIVLNGSNGTNTNYGIYSYYTYGTSSYRSLVANNFISQMNGTGTTYGIYHYYSGYTDYYHNSVNIMGGNTSSYGMYFYSPSSSSNYLNSNVVNNISVVKGGGYAIYVGSGSITSYNPVATMDYNNWYSTGTNLGSWSGTAATTLSAWQTASSRDANSISMDPVYKSSTDLHVSAVNMDNKGTAASTIIADDIDGKTRNTATPDVGAHEYDVYALDAGIYAILSPSPTAAVCPGTATIQVRAMNYGSTTITSLDIKYKKNFSGSVNTYALTSISLAPNAYADYNIGTLTLSQGDSIYVWTDAPNSSTDLQTGNDMIVSPAYLQLKGVLTVGGTNPHFATLKDATTYMNAYGICGPVTLLIREGVYNQNIYLGKIPGISSTNTVTIRNDYANTKAVEFQYAAGGSTDNYLVRFENSKYITVKNITFRATSGSYGRIIDFVNDNRYITIDSCKMYGRLGATTGSNDYIVYKPSTSNYKLYNVSFTNNTIKYGSMAFYIYGYSSANLDTNVYIIKNQIDSFYYMGVYFYNQGSPRVINNYISDIGQYTSTVYGLYTYYSYNDFDYSTNMIIVKSTNNSQGIRVYYGNGSSGLRGKITNNYVYTPIGLGSNYGIYGYYIQYIDLYSNTFNVAKGDANSTALYFYSPSSSYSYNNIVNNNAINTGSGYAFYYYDPANGNTYNYNNYYVPKTSASIGYSASYGSFATLGNWQSYGYDLNSQNQSVTFMPANTPNHFMSSLNAGAGYTGITTDIYGTTRKTTPTIGAYEYYPPALDAGISAITSLSIPICSTPQAISVTLTNYGTSSVTRDTIWWTINGGTPQYYAWTGTLNGGQSTNVNIGSLALTTGTFYSLKVYTSKYINGVPGTSMGTPDPQPYNDTFFRNNISLGLPGGTYTINPSQASSSTNFQSFTEAVTRINNGGLCGGAVTINVSDGTYNEQILLTAPGTSSANQIIFQSASFDSSKVILSYANATSEANYVVKFNGASYITFKNMTIQSTNPTFARVLELATASNYNQFLNNVFISPATTTTSNNNAVIYSYGNTTSTHCQYNQFRYNAILNGSYGIYFSGYSYPSTYGFVANNNLVKDFYYQGIFVQSYRGIETNNNIMSSTSSTTLYGIYLSSFGYNSYCNNNTITLTSTSGAYGIQFNSGYYNNTANDNIITLSAGSTAYGVYFSSCYYDNIFRNNTINVTTTGTGYGMYLNSNYYTHETNNNNIVVSANSTQYGIYYNYSQNNSSGKFNLSNNKILLKGSNGTNTNYGIYYYYSYGTSSYRSLVSNNFITQMNGTGTTYGIYHYYAGYTDYYHNSINILGGNTSSYGMYFYSPSSSTSYLNTNVYNNISSITGGGYAVYVGSGSITSYNPVSLMNYNDWYSSGANLANWNGTAQNNLAAWRIASSTFDVNSVSFNPSFVSPNTGDLHLTSGALKSGIVLPEVTTDIDGESRTTAQSYIGADHYIADYNLDIVSMLPTLPYIGSIPITVTLKNNGYKDIPAQNIYLSYRLGTGAWVLDTFIMSSPLISMATADYTFKQKLTISAAGTYTITTRINPQITGDPDPSDTFFITGYTALAPGTYYIDGTGKTSGAYTTFNAAKNALNYGIAGPVTFIVLPYTYTERVVFNPVTGVSSNARVVFEGSNRSSCILTYNGSSTTDRSTIVLNGADYITFKNLTINSSNTSYSNCVFLTNAADYNTISGCVLNSVTSTGYYNHVINAAQGEDANYATSTYYGNSANYTLIENNTINYGGATTNSTSYFGAVNFVGTSTSVYCTGNKVIGNTFNYAYYKSIQLQYQTDFEISRNLFNNNFIQASSAYTINTYYCRNTYIDANIIYPGMYAIYLGYENNYSPYGTSYITNNMISNFANTSNNYGVYLNNGRGLYAAHNSIRINGTSNSYSNTCLHGINSGQGSTIKNNIFARESAGCLLSFQTVNSPFEIEYNAYYYPGSTSNYTFYTTSGPGYIYDFATWKAWTSGAYGVHDLNSWDNINPYYTSVTNLHLSSSSPRLEVPSLGSVVPALLLDIDKEPRKASGKVLVGADQPPSMKLLSVSAEHPDTSDAVTGTKLVKIITAKINVSGLADALPIGEIHFSTSGTSDTNNIVKARLFDWDGNPLSAANQVGETDFVGSNLSFSFNTGYVVPVGNSLFLAYDIDPLSPLGNYLDASFDSIKINDTMRYPSISNPIGKRRIGEKAFAIHPDTGGVFAGFNWAKILKVSISAGAGGPLNQFSITRLYFNAASSTNPSDIVAARLYDVDGNPLSFETPLGNPVINPSGTFYFDVYFNFQSTKDFWLALDINPKATIGNIIDASCDSIVIDGITYTVKSSNPPGNVPVIHYANYLRYCDVTRLNAGGFLIGTKKVVFEEINNSTLTLAGGIGTTNTAVQVYPYPLPSVFKKVSYPILIQHGELNVQSAGIFIDWNNDGVFDVTESVKMWLNLPEGAITKDNITIPCYATPGVHRMRIASDYGTVTPLVCTSTQYGEVEDYFIYVEEETAPKVSVEYPDTTYLNGLTIFTPSSDVEGNIIYLWDYDSDGNTDDTASVGKYYFTSTGTKAVTVKAVLYACDDTLVSQPLVVTPFVITPTSKPIVNFVSNVNTITKSMPVDFIDLTTMGPTSWKWVITPDTVLGLSTHTFYPSNTDREPTVMFHREGNYTVKLVVTNMVGIDSMVKIDYITVVKEMLMCSDQSTNLRSGFIYDDGGLANNYSNPINPTGDKTCSFLIKPKCATSITLDFVDFDVANITTNACPTLPPDALKVYDGENNTGIPLHLDLKDMLGNPIYPNGFTNGANNLIMPPPASIISKTGSLFLEFYVNCRAVGAGFELKWSTTVLTPPDPVAIIDAPDTAYTDQPITFTSKSTGVQLDFEWDLTGNGIADNWDSIAYWTYTQTGTYKIRLIVNSCEKLDTVYHTLVILKPTKKPAIEFEADFVKVTTYDNVTLTDKSDKTVGQWRWEITPADYSIIDGALDKPIVKVKFDKLGYYNVKLVGTNSIGSDSLTKTSYIYVYKSCQPQVGVLSSDVGISQVVFLNSRGDTLIDQSSLVGISAYTDYSNTKRAVVSKKGTYTLSLYRNSNFNKITRSVFIDLNQNGDFDDAGEEIATDYNATTLSWTVKITIPSAIPSGLYKMRLATNAGQLHNKGCGPNYSGEFEDYGLIITDDIYKPVITLYGGNFVISNSCESFVDPGYYAFDVEAGDLTSKVIRTGYIDSTKAGIYELKYNVSDPAGNKADEVVREVEVLLDIIKPTINLTGNNPEYVPVFGTYTEAGFTAADNCSGIKQTSSSGTVNTMWVGHYQIEYVAEDNAGNTVKVYRDVFVQDKKDPTISLIGTNPIYHEVNTVFTDPGANVADNYDNNISYTVKGTVNPYKIGTYFLTYCTTDSSGNGPVCVDRDVIVEDTKAPDITLNGDNPYILDVHKNFNDPGVDVTDNYYDKTGILIFTTGSVNNYQLGNYTIEYKAIDGSGNQSATISRTVSVVDRVKPTIELIGPSIFTVEQWQTFDDPGIKVSDNYYPKSQLTITYNANGNYPGNTLELGLYTYTYSVCDPSGNCSGDITRTIYVVPSTSSLDESDVLSNINYYPNPAQKEVTIDMHLPFYMPVNIAIYNSLGQKVMNVAEGFMDQYFGTLNIESLSSGLYFIRFNVGEHQINNKLIIAR